MTNLIRGHIYQLKKDRFFYGCLGIGLIFLAVTIRIFLLGFTSDPGMTSMMQTFLGGDMVLYAFMVLAANHCRGLSFRRHEEHRRTRHFKEELLFIYGLYYFRRIRTGDAGAVHFYGHIRHEQIRYGNP